jgi:hypothetical protein
MKPTAIQKFHFGAKRFVLILLMFGGALGSFFNFISLSDPDIPVETFTFFWYARCLLMLGIAIVAGVLHVKTMREYVEKHPENYPDA